VRRRVWREAGTILGVALVLVGVVFFNSQYQRLGKYDRYDKMRTKIETARRQAGMEILNWKLFQSTKGTYRSGAKYHTDLLGYNGQRANLIGFMVPLEQFRSMSEFMLLPVPIECYFCESPPMRDVMLVSMREGNLANLVEEPVLINGTLQLNEGPSQQFFYTLEDAQWGAATADTSRGALTPKETPIEHRIPKHDETTQEELIPGQLPPGAEAQ
jgi:hypothetical protein